MKLQREKEEMMQQMALEQARLVSEYTQLELTNAKLMQDLKAAANLNQKGPSPNQAEAPGPSQEELHFALQKASQEKDELLTQMAKEKQDLIEHTKTLEEAHARIVEEAQLATMRLAAEKQSLEEQIRHLAEEKVAAERDRDGMRVKVREVERERERAEERLSVREAAATLQKLPLAPTASTTVEELTAELDGALHIKEQEAIIAEVRSSGFECLGFIPTLVAAPCVCARALALAAPRWACGPFLALTRRCIIRAGRQEQCEEQCKAILEIVDADLLSVPTMTFSDTSHNTKSTVRRLPHLPGSAVQQTVAAARARSLLLLVTS
jgi:hypothetical protein